MDLNSPIFDRVRAKPKAKEPVHSVKVRCDHPGCAEPGEFRAPMGWQREGEYFSFCLEHVRAYNASYNYFQGMSAEAVALYQRDASTGHRPTWVMGNNVAGGPQTRGSDPSHYADPLNIFSNRTAARRPAEPAKPKYGIAVRKALDHLGLDENADADAIRSRYKDMVKRLHPDANGGDRSLEDKLREIIRAYNYLKSVKLA
ncbi:DnaJ domain-containing protein [uncultured Methylovirgula sp.]|uniref:J domain-containing protein n=1 Tax=uncultured Methylovirgula sp. TaxID=1285960 RepID=UPI00260B8B0E|nr:DnaJ domain-containing protein [uncultured Methylovirgula sp.]